MPIVVHEVQGDALDEAKREVSDDDAFDGDASADDAFGGEASADVASDGGTDDGYSSADDADDDDELKRFVTRFVG